MQPEEREDIRSQGHPGMQVLDLERDLVYSELRDVQQDIGLVITFPALGSQAGIALIILQGRIEPLFVDLVHKLHLLALCERPPDP